MPHWRWMLNQLTRRLWFRATLVGMLGVAAAILAAVAERYIPWKLPWDIGAEAVDGLLTIIASSMLAVTTFSLNVMTSAYGSATNNVTPRATMLLREDRVTQNVLSTFIGSFLFGIVGLVVLKTGAYGARGRVVLFIVTVFVIALIVLSLLRWIDYLTRFGQVGETTTRVEAAAREAIEARVKSQFLGGSPLLDPGQDIPDEAVPVESETVGYVQHIDIPALSRCCAEAEGGSFSWSTPAPSFMPGRRWRGWRRRRTGKRRTNRQPPCARPSPSAISAASTRIRASDWRC